MVVEIWSFGFAKSSGNNSKGVCTNPVRINIAFSKGVFANLSH